MEKYIFFAIYLVVFLFLAGVAAAETIQINRPWHDIWWEKTQYPYIFDLSIDYPIYISLGMVYSPLMEERITELQLENMTKLKTNGTATEKIIEAKSNADIYLKENDYMKKCSENCLVNYQVFAAYCVIDKFQFELAEWANEMRFGTFCGLQSPFLGLFELRKRWQGTMDASMDALEESQSTADNAVMAARKQYKELEYAGMCSEAYAYAGGEECRKMKKAFDIVDGGQQEARYGQANLVKADIVRLNEQLAENANTTLYPRIMTIIWGENGIIQTFGELEREGKTAKERAEGQYIRYAGEATDSRFYAEQPYDEAKNQKLEIITEAIDTEGFEKERIGTIAERWALLEDKKEEADYYYNNAKSAYDKKARDYFFTGISGMQRARQGYDAVKNGSEAILEDAKKIVLDKRAKASEKIGETKENMKKLGYGEQQINDALKEANAAFAAGEEARTLGEKYENYAKALQLAAGAAPTKSFEYEKSYQTLLAEMEALLKNAEKDGIDVADLKAETEFIKDTRPQNELKLLAEIKEEIVTRMKNRYYDLEEKRKELIEKLKAAGAADLLNEMREAESGIVRADGSIDWPAAAGRLKQLSSKYNQLLDELNSDIEKRNDAIANQLIVESSLIAGRVKIDQPTNIEYVLTIANPKPYEGREVTVKVPLEGEFRLNYADIKDGREGVLGMQTDYKTMKITLEKIGGFERKTVIFEKGVVLAATRSQETQAKGIGGGTATINEKIIFQLAAGNVEIDTDGRTNALIDGTDARRRLNEGIHTLTSERTDNNAYSEERADAEISQENGKTRVRYGIIVKPSINLDEVAVIAETGNGVSNIEIFCGTQKCIKQPAGNNYIITLYDVKKGIPATVSVSYLISNVSQFAAVEIAKYENSNEPEIIQMAQEAKGLLASGDETGALRKVEEMKKYSAALENEKAKLLKNCYDASRGIRNEIEDLDRAIEKARELGLNAGEIEKFITRREMLSEVLEQNAAAENDTKEEMEKKLDELKAIDNGWLKKEISAIAKKATKDFENYKKQLGGTDEAQRQLKIVENDINTLLSTERATDAVQLLYSIEQLGLLEESISAGRRAGLASLEEDFNTLRAIAEKLLTAYESEYRDAKSSGQEDQFSLTPNSVKTTISNIEAYLKAENIEKANHTMGSDLARQVRVMNETLNALEANAARKIAEMENALETKKPQLSAEQLATASKKIMEAKNFFNAKSYGKAIVKAAEAINYINSLKGNMDTVTYLIAASIALIAIIAFFLYGKQGKKEAAARLPLLKAEEEN